MNLDLEQNNTQHNTPEQDSALKPAIIFLNGPETETKKKIVSHLRSHFKHAACLALYRKELLKMFSAYDENSEESFEWLVMKVAKNILNNGVFVLFDAFLPSRRMEQYVQQMKGLPCYWIGIFFKEEKDQHGQSVYDYSIKCLNGDPVSENEMKDLVEHAIEISTEAPEVSTENSHEGSIENEKDLIEVQPLDVEHSDENVKKVTQNFHGFLEPQEAAEKIFEFISNNQPRCFDPFKTVEFSSRKRMKSPESDSRNEDRNQESRQGDRREDRFRDRPRYEERSNSGRDDSFRRRPVSEEGSSSESENNSNNEERKEFGDFRKERPRRYSGEYSRNEREASFRRRSSDSENKDAKSDAEGGEGRRFGREGGQDRPRSFGGDRGRSGGFNRDRSGGRSLGARNDRGPFRPRSFGSSTEDGAKSEAQGAEGRRFGREGGGDRPRSFGGDRGRSGGFNRDRSPRSFDRNAWKSDPKLDEKRSAFRQFAKKDDGKPANNFRDRPNRFDKGFKKSPYKTEKK